MFADFTEYTIVNIYVWIWQLYAPVWNLARAYLHFSIGEESLYRMMKVQPRESTLAGSKKLKAYEIEGTIQIFIACWQFGSLYFGNIDSQFVVYPFDIWLQFVEIFHSLVIDMRSPVNEKGNVPPGIIIFLVNFFLESMVVAVMIFGLYIHPLISILQ